MNYRFWLWLFILALVACNGPPPDPCEDAPSTWPECESTGGVWIAEEDRCDCVCPADQYFQEDIGCKCPDGYEWVEDRCLPLRVDMPPDPKKIVGITAFALPLHDREYIEAACKYIKSHGYNTLRVGFETWRWNGQLGRRTATPGTYDIGREMAARGYLPEGPKFDSEENLANIRRMLDTTARAGVWVELIPVFTIKGLDDVDTPAMRRKATNLARRLVLDGDYKHVFFSYTNEWSHSGRVGPRISRDEVIDGLQRLKSANRLVTTDDGGSWDKEKERWDAKYPREFLPYVDMVAFHPHRNPEPTEWDLSLGVSRYVIREEKLACLYNETVSYASDEELERYPWLVNNFRIANRGRPPESKRKQIIIDYKARTLRVGGTFYYHCIACFFGDVEFEEFWIP